MRPSTRNVRQSTLASRPATKRATTSYWSFAAIVRLVGGKRWNTSMRASAVQRTSDPLSMNC